MLKSKSDFMKFGKFLQKSIQDYFPETLRKDNVQEIPGWSIFSVVTVPPRFNCYFREWAGNPFHFVVEHKRKKLCQLDLTRVIENNDRYTWYLAAPTNAYTKNMYNKLFEFYKKIPSAYDKQVVEQKAYLGSFTRFKKSGYLFIENGSLDELQDKFLDFIKALYESVEYRIELKPRQKKEIIFDLEDVEAEEGYKEDKIYLYTTRNRDIVNKRKQLDDYTCQICGFKFELNGKKIIECHHLNPLSEGEARITKIEDLVSVCPTCHRIIHLRKPPFSIEEVKQLINRRN